MYVSLVQAHYVLIFTGVGTYSAYTRANLFKTIIIVFFLIVLYIFNVTLDIWDFDILTCIPSKTDRQRKTTGEIIGQSWQVSYLNILRYEPHSQVEYGELMRLEQKELPGSLG